MTRMGDAWDDDEISVIGDKGKIGFIDYQDYTSVCGYNPEEEGPATVSNPFPFVEGKPRSVFIGEICADAITVTNTLDEPVDMWCKIYASSPEGAFSLSLMEPPKDSADSERIGFVGSHTLEDRMIQPGQTLNIWLSCKPEDIGLYTTVVHLDIGTHRVERVAFLLAEDNISHSLTARKPYLRGSRKKNVSVDAYVEGSCPVRVINRGYKKRLPRYDIPQDIRRNSIRTTGANHKNYRCHPEILHLPSKLFYQGDLVACKKDTTTYLESVSFLPNKEFPVLFLGIQGCDEREGNNPSWFNRTEISKVVQTIRKLTANGSILEEDIGVITPYKQQVLKLNEVLERFDMTEIKVGSVEQFQGQEKQVIIISTVRSTMKHNDFDKVHCLGFLSNPKRFNVAITRAKSLLVIIGNPHIICKDINWQQLLWRCVDNGSYQGCALPDRPVCAGEDPAEPEVAEDGANPKWAQNPEWSDDWAEGNAVPVTAEAGWSNDWEEGNPVPFMAEAEGPNWEIENPKPITNRPEQSNGWENGNCKPITDQPGHSNVWESENQKPSSDPKPFPDEAKWYFEWEIENRQLIMNGSKYLNDWKDDDPKPITNKAGYSLKRRNPEIRRSTAKKADWSNEWNFEVLIPTAVGNFN